MCESTQTPVYLHHVSLDTKSLLDIATNNSLEDLVLRFFLFLEKKASLNSKLSFIFSSQTPFPSLQPLLSIRPRGLRQLQSHNRLRVMGKGKGGKGAGYFLTLF
jgi:hypothetical protein